MKTGSVVTRYSEKAQRENFSDTGLARSAKVAVAYHATTMAVMLVYWSVCPMDQKVALKYSGSTLVTRMRKAQSMAGTKAATAPMIATTVMMAQTAMP